MTTTDVSSPAADAGATPPAAPTRYPGGHGGLLGFACLLLIVAAQVLINYHTWLISGPDHLYYLRALNTHPLPYIDTRIEYPVLTGVFMTVSAGLTHGLVDYLRLNSVLLGACAVGCAWTLWSMSRRAAWAFALTPLLIVFSLANWDLFAILLMLLGWRSYRKGNHATAGVWLALGVFAKLFPIFLLGGCAIALVRRWRLTTDPAQRTHARDDVARFGVAAVIASAIVNLPFAIPAYSNWIWFWKYNEQRNGNADLLHLVHILHNSTSLSTSNHVLTAIVLVAVIAGAIGIWRGASVARVAALVFAVFMVMEKVYSPQYTLWVFAYGVIGDWDPWTLVALSLVGLTDDATAAVHIALTHDNASVALQWFNANIAPREQGFRLFGLIAPACVMLLREFRPDRFASGRHRDVSDPGVLAGVG